MGPNPPYSAPGAILTVSDCFKEREGRQRGERSDIWEGRGICERGEGERVDREGREVLESGREWGERGGGNRGVRWERGEEGEREVMQREVGGERDVGDGGKEEGVWGDEIGNIMLLNNDSLANKNYMELHSTILYHHFLWMKILWIFYHFQIL